MNANIRTVRPRFAMIAMVAACLALTACQDDVTTASASTPASTPASSSSSQSTSVALSGAPNTTATAGTDYLYQPSLTQGSGDVTFSVTGLPKWATFDSNTGVLTGTPATSDEGKTGAITITASNGSSTAAVGPFTIQVNAPAATATVSLSWNAPIQNSDGTPITGLAGFHIYYGTVAGALSSTATVSSPTTTTYTLSGLAHGTYYFSVVAYNASGQDSKSSNMASTTI